MRSKIEGMIIDELNPDFVEVVDNSYLHAGHQGSPGGSNTHFLIKIKADILNGKTRIESHRMINRIMSQEFLDGLHSLQIEVIK